MYLLQFLFVVRPLSVRQPHSDPSTTDSARRKEATWNSDKYVGTDEYIYHRIYHEIFETALVWYVLTPPGFWHAATVVHNLIHRTIYLPKSDVIYLVTSTARETPLDSKIPIRAQSNSARQLFLPFAISSPETFALTFWSWTHILIECMEPTSHFDTDARILLVHCSFNGRWHVWEVSERAWKCLSLYYDSQKKKKTLVKMVEVIHKPCYKPINDKMLRESHYIFLH